MDYEQLKRDNRQMAEKSVDGVGRETAEGMLRRQMAQLEERLATKRALLEVVLKAAPLTEKADLSLLELLWREDIR